MKNQDLTKLIKAENSLFDLAVNSFPNKKLNTWVLEVHKCPVCSKPVLDWNEYEFVIENGMCLSCEHANAEAREQRAYDEWKDAGCPELPEA